MLTRQIIEQVVDSQEERLSRADNGLKRDVPGLPALSSHALIITGIRRCGKSTWLHQIHKSLSDPSLFLNFEDPRLSGFDMNDFNRLHEICVDRGIETLLFDEIQNIEKWENFIRFRLDENYRVYITGSNASMLSRELGTKLTGRHISRELFPFSYNEFLEYKGQNPGPESFNVYLESGGFPEMIRTDLAEMLMHTFNDVVIRDIALRYGIKNTSILQQLAVWLISNTGKPISGNSLRKIFPIGSSSSIMDYLNHFAEAYLFFFVPKFSYSPKVQLVNPRKVYSIDTGLVAANSLSFSNDKGRLLENLVFLQLRRNYHDIFYFSEKRECDFVVFNKGKAKEIIQSCWELNRDNLDREIEGMVEALDFFGSKTGLIITFDQSDKFTIREKTIIAKPFYEWGNNSSIPPGG